MSGAHQILLHPSRGMTIVVWLSANFGSKGPKGGHFFYFASALNGKHYVAHGAATLGAIAFVSETPRFRSHTSHHREIKYAKKQTDLDF